ncbi:MAG TPA: hypothetical protein VLC79_02280 [Cellvibrio sp.]|nr:hypothetical protein [Cellvibrio sp.]
MKASRLIITTCVGLAVVVAFIFYGQQDQAHQITQMIPAEAVKAESIAFQSTHSLPENKNVTASRHSAADESPKADPSTKVEPWNTPAGYEHVEKWRESRGYFSDTDYRTYENYGIETVKRLASEGDLKAIRTLAVMYLKDRDPELVVTTLREAAVWGSTEALILVGMIKNPHGDNSRFNGPDGELLYKEEMLESLAIFKAASIRGDRAVDERVTEARSKVTLTADDDEYIEQRGAEIYNEMAEKRKTLGLGPFDDSVPQQVRDYFDAEAKRSRTD